MLLGHPSTKFLQVPGSFHGILWVSMTFQGVPRDLVLSFPLLWHCLLLFLSHQFHSWAIPLYFHQWSFLLSLFLVCWSLFSLPPFLPWPPVSWMCPVLIENLPGPIPCMTMCHSLQSVFGAINGLKLPCQVSCDVKIKNTMYNRWFHSHFVSLVIVFNSKGLCSSNFT